MIHVKLRRFSFFAFIFPMQENRIFHWARTHPEKPAIVCNDVVLGYMAFWKRIEAARNFFARWGLPEGGTAIVLVSNLLDTWVVVTALRLLGLDTVSVRSIAQAEELQLRNVACVVVTQAEREQHALTGKAMAGTKVIALPTALRPEEQSGVALRGQVSPPRPGGHILLTSGTTGRDKKFLLSGASEWHRNEARARSWGFNADTVHHGCDFPLRTGAGFKQPMAVWHAGGCVVIKQGADIYSDFFRHGITSTALTPVMLKNLLAAKNAGKPFHAGFLLAVGAGFLSLGLAKQAVKRFTDNVEIQYGATELGVYALHSRFDDEDSLHWLTPAAGCLVQVVDGNGVECPVGQEGELRILTTEIDGASYLDDEAASAAMFREGFFYPGDMAVSRADGRIRILGRSADVLNWHGKKIPVAPIEQSIQSHLRANEVCIFAGLNDRGEEEIVIAVESNRVFERSLLEAIGRKFTSFERIRFEIRKEFPRAGSGMRKVQRAALRKLVF